MKTEYELEKVREDREAFGIGICLVGISPEGEIEVEHVPYTNFFKMESEDEN